MNETPVPRLAALLLVGPTGSGKTPLGDWLQAHGLRGHRCHHFDFGANLRAVVAAGPNDAFPDHEIKFLESVLTQGALLEDEQAPLATKILRRFLAARGVRLEDRLVLNGLPRHIGQARALEPLLEVRAVLELACSAAAVRERLHRDPGGDRAARTDDTGTLVARKLATYAERTRPLLAFYREAGAMVISVSVTATSLPQEMAQGLEHWLLGEENTPNEVRAVRP